MYPFGGGNGTRWTIKKQKKALFDRRCHKRNGTNGDVLPQEKAAHGKLSKKYFVDIFGYKISERILECVKLLFRLVILCASGSVFYGAF